MVSPLAIEEEVGSVKPNARPSRRLIALSKESRVRVLGSKNRVAKIFPLQKPAQVAGCSFIWSANRKICSISKFDRSASVIKSLMLQPPNYQPVFEANLSGVDSNIPEFRIQYQLKHWD